MLLYNQTHTHTHIERRRRRNNNNNKQNKQKATNGSAKTIEEGGRLTDWKDKFLHGEGQALWLYYCTNGCQRKALEQQTRATIKHRIKVLCAVLGSASCYVTHVKQSTAANVL